MQKILDLNEKEFLTGIAPSSQVQDKGMWSSALGIDPISALLIGNDATGLLQPGAAPIDITGSVVAGVPFAWDTDVSTTGTEDLYIWDDAGNLYLKPLINDTGISLVGAMGSGPANGIFVMQHATGGKYIYLFFTGNIGRYGDLHGSPTIAPYHSGLQSTKDHPIHPLFDRYYFGNGRYIGSAADNGGSDDLVIENEALDFPAQYTVKTLSDDGTYLVAGITTTLSTDTLARGHSKVIFWDTNQDSWQREWMIPDAAILSIQRVGTAMMAVTTRGLFAFTFNSPPEQLLPYLSTDYAPDYGYPTQYAADVMGESIQIGGDSSISTFGKVSPNVPNALLRPYAGFSGFVTMIASSAKTSRTFVGTSNSKMYVVIPGVPPLLTGVSAKTIYIDLARWWQVGLITLEFDGQLASGDDVSVSVEGDDATSSSAFGSATFAANGAIRSKEMYGSKEARKLKLIINFNGGAARIRNIQVWGDPIETPTHTRT